MSFGGPPPAATIPSGPFESAVVQVASSPYTIAAAIFLLNIGGRFLPMEITKGQENFMNQPWFRRLIIFVIFFVATRNLIIAGMLSIVIILLVSYLLNENSSMFLFKGYGNEPRIDSKRPSESLTSDEQEIFRRLSEKHARIQQQAGTPFELKSSLPSKHIEAHNNYQKTLRNLWLKMSN
jgi:hypothetical protein